MLKAYPQNAQCWLKGIALKMGVYFAAVVIRRLITSTSLTLLIIPHIYSHLKDSFHRKKRKVHQKEKQ